MTKPVIEPQISKSGLPPVQHAAAFTLLDRSEVWILPTLVTDRYGNTVTYTYNPAKPANLKTIQASDGRQLTLHYASDASGETNQVDSVSDGTRTWNYSYVGGTLDRVTLPDNSAWQVGGMNPTLVNLQSAGTDCDYPGTISSVPLTGTMVHPSGATGSFTLSPVRHGRSNVFRQCVGSTDAGWSYPSYPRNFDTFSLTRKSIAGPGLDDLTWTYDYGPDNASWEGDCTSGCPGTVTTIVADPKGDTTRYTYGNGFHSTEGQLHSVDIDGIRVTRNRYRGPDTGEFVNPVGTSDQTLGDSQIANALRPLDQRVITQQGVDFRWEVPAGKFDAKGRATQVVRSNSLGNSRTETTAYDDRLAKWVLGQVSTVTEAGTGKVMVANTFDPATGSRLTESHFGHLDFTMTYGADGTLATRKDGLNQTTRLSNYRRGIPQNVLYADGTSESAVVENIGTVSSMINAAGYMTRLGYDVMGRLASITHPFTDTVAWKPTTIRLYQSASPQFDLPAGHWRQQINTGQAYTVNYLDALWRIVYTEKWDDADAGATMRIVKHAYDFAGRKKFDSYPKRSYGQLGDGIFYEYDALGRQKSSAANSELGNIFTSSWYNSGFRKATVDARGIVTNYSYQAFDQPTEDAITNIAAAEGVNVAIARDVFGKPRSITRSGAGKSATRGYVYDAYYRLCKTIEPETGATVQDYDAANNVTWRASGLALPSTAGCDTASVPAARKISYGFDALNRLKNTTFSDGSPAIARTYTADGLPNTISSNGAVWTNSYNKRRLNERESLAYGGVTYNIDRTYDANGSLLQLKYPDNTTVGYNPNALGEPRQVGAYANAITYHPNGALASFNYGSSATGIAHSTTQNVRGLPWTSVDSGMINDEYTYDVSGNVIGIADRLQPSVSSRTMAYDDLDRLKTVTAPGLWAPPLTHTMRSTT